MLARAHKSIAPFENAIVNLRLYFVLLESQRLSEDADKEEQQKRKANRNPRRKASKENSETSPPQITTSNYPSVSSVAMS